MIRIPIPGDCWLPALGLALLVLAAVACLPWFSQDSVPTSAPPFRPEGYHVAAGFLALVGIGALMNVRSRRPDTPLPFLAAVVGGIVSTAYYWRFLQGFSYSPMLLQLPSALLIGGGVPFLWGSAIVKKEHPEDRRSRRVAKIAAQVILAGFACVFLLEALPYLYYASRFARQSGGPFNGSSGVAILYSLLRVGGRILLLWSVIETLRKPKDAETDSAHAIRVYQLLWGWFAFVAANSLVTLVRLFVWRGPTFLGRTSLWHGTVFLVLTLTITCLVARRYRLSPDAGSRWAEPAPTEDAG